MIRTTVGASMVVAATLAGTGVAAADPAIGVMADVGVPDGGTASLVYRPISPVRLSAGLSHNLVGPGVRGGITLIPLSSWITPTLSASYGRFVERDANPTARRLSGDPMLSSPALERVGYDYADAHLGLELGRKRVTFFLHAGMTRISGHVRNLGQLGADAEPSDVTVTFTHDPSVTVTTVSARLGLILYLL